MITKADLYTFTSPNLIKLLSQCIGIKVTIVPAATNATNNDMYIESLALLINSFTSLFTFSFFSRFNNTLNIIF